MDKTTKALYLLSATEMWERFSYYGMRALLVLYLTKSLIDGGLGFTESNASLLYGVFTGLVYFTPLIGGWLADSYIGQRRSITIGAITMILGQLSLFYESNLTFLYIGLFLLVIGNGFFKPNISVIVGKLYPPEDIRRDSAYTIFYMGINVGAFFSPLIAGYFALQYGFRYGFLVAAVGLFIGLVLYQIFGKRLLGDLGLEPEVVVSKENEGQQQLTKEEKDRVRVILVFVLFSIFFFAGFEQAGSSMTLYTNKYIDRVVGDFEIPTAWFQSVNPLFIVAFAPILTMLWTHLSKVGKNPSIPVKMAFGMILLGIGFFVLYCAVLQRGGDVEDETIKANLMFMVMAYFFNTLGELCLSPIGLSMVSKLAPIKLASLMMGFWLLSSFFANIVGGFLASYTTKLGAGNIFLSIAIFSVVLGIILLSIRKILIKKSHGVL